MRTLTLSITAAVILFVSGNVCATDTYFYDDAIIEDGVYDVVWVYDTPPDVTTVHMFGGSVRIFATYNSSTINIHSGVLEWGVTMRNSSTINIYDGYIMLEAPGIGDSSTLNIYGGDIGMGQPSAWGSSTINIYGYGFSEFPAFSLTGYLSDGSPFEFIELTYAIPHINLIVIPEPVTILLFGLGGLALLRRHRA